MARVLAEHIARDGQRHHDESLGVRCIGLEVDSEDDEAVAQDEAAWRASVRKRVEGRSNSRRAKGLL